MNVLAFINKISSVVEKEGDFLRQIIPAIEEEKDLRLERKAIPTQEVVEFCPGEKLYWGLSSDEDITIFINKKEVSFVGYTKSTDITTKKILEICEVEKIESILREGAYL